MATQGQHRSAEMTGIGLAILGLSILGGLIFYTTVAFSLRWQVPAGLMVIAALAAGYLLGILEFDDETTAADPQTPGTAEFTGPLSSADELETYETIFGNVVVREGAPQDTPSGRIVTSVPELGSFRFRRAIRDEEPSEE